MNALGLCVNLCATVNLGFVQAQLGGCQPCDFVNNAGSCKPACTKLNLGYTQSTCSGFYLDLLPFAHSASTFVSDQNGDCSCNGIEVAGKCIEACPLSKIALGFVQGDLQTSLFSHQS